MYLYYTRIIIITIIRALHSAARLICSEFVNLDTHILESEGARTHCVVEVRVQRIGGIRALNDVRWRRAFDSKYNIIGVDKIISITT